jgi:hypothetical protein
MLMQFSLQANLAQERGEVSDGTQQPSRHRLGRPRRPTETLRRNRVVTMVTDVELEQLAELADKQNMPLSSIVHQILTRYLRRTSR